MLRPYQIQQKGAVFAAWNQGHRRVLVQAPTGSGKTVLAASICLELLSAGKRVLYLVPSVEILNQTRTKLERRHLRVSTYADARKQPLSRRMVLGMLQTFARREFTVPGWEPDVILVDEAHLMLSHLTYAVTRYKRALVLCLTATPERFDGRSLSPIADLLIPGPPIWSLISAGSLSKMRVVRFQSPPGGRLTPAQVVDQWERHARGRMTVSFLRTKAMSRAVVAEFNKRGIPAEHVDETVGKKQREFAVSSLRAGKTQVLCNVGILTQGVDIEPLACVLLERETSSVSRYLQMTGRGSRVSPGKADCLILDLATRGTGNSWGFGEPWIDRQWSLTERNRPIRSVLPKRH